MMHVSPTDAVRTAQGKGPTRRALAKQETRAKVLDAARRLFSEHGYEGATIRDIATAAGMSTGAVFANFADKADLFQEIMSTDMGELSGLMASAAAEEDGVEDALGAMLAAGYSFYQAQLPLVRAAFSASFALHSSTTRRTAPGTATICDLILQQLERGVAAGQLRSDADLQLRSEMIFDAYLANFSRAFRHALDADTLAERARVQVEIILASARTA
jgi:AcrR family transcriptional regulator